jgi:hypothetical protein
MHTFQGSGFTMALPDNCMDASAYAFVLPENAGFSANLSVRFEPAPGVNDLQAHVNVSLDALKASVDDFQMLNQVAGKRGENYGVMSNFEWGTGATRVRQKQYCLLVPGEVPRLYTLTATDLASNASQSDPVFNRMMKHFTPNDVQLF